MKVYHLRTLRIRRGMTQEELERETQVAQNTISKLESNPRVRPVFTTVMALATALRVRPEQLRFGPDPKDRRVLRRGRKAQVLVS